MASDWSKLKCRRGEGNHGKGWWRVCIRFDSESQQVHTSRMATRFPVLVASCVLLPLLIVGCLSMGNSAALGGAPPAKTPLEERLSRIIIPKLELQDATFVESLDFILHKVQELDPASGAIKTSLPLETGVPVVSDGPGIPGLDAPKSAAPAGRFLLADVRLTVKLAEIPALDALRYITSLSILRFRIDGDTVHFMPMDAAKSSPASPHK